MSLLSEVELGHLNFIADELREAVAERGHRVEVATEADPAFGSGWSTSALRRDLVLDVVGVSASQAGIDFRSC